MSESVTPAGNDGEARFKWKTLALWSLTFGLVSLTALAVVATITKADTLSVVALALAVLAFVVQIIVFIVQGNAAAHQAADTAALNAQTLSALAAIEAKSEGTRETVGKISDRLLEFAFNKASNEAETSGAPQPALQVIERAKEIIEADNNDEAAAPVPATTERKSPPPTKKKNPAPPVRPLLDGPLHLQEIRQVESLIDSLDLESDDLPIVGMYRLGEDVLAAERAGRSRQAGLSAVSGDLVLHAKGLVRRVRVDWSSEPQFVLTDDGRLLAKALLISPAPASEKIIKWRRFAEDFVARVAKSMADSRRTTDTIPVEM